MTDPEPDLWEVDGRDPFDDFTEVCDPTCPSCERKTCPGARAGACRYEQEHTR